MILASSYHLSSSSLVSGVNSTSLVRASASRPIWSFSSIIPSLSYHQGEACLRSDGIYSSPSPAASSLPAPAKIRQDHHNHVSDEPDIIRTHILIDVDQD